MRAIGWGSCRLLAVPVLLLLNAPSAEERAVDACIRTLRRAVEPSPDNAHVTTLAALRQLRDPLLRSFFLQLAQNADPEIRVFAILGLAEIDEQGRVDPWLITQLDDVSARYRVIEEAIAADMLETAQMHELLMRDDIEAEARLLLMAALAGRGEAIDAGEAAALARDPRLDVAGRAAFVLAQLGDDAALKPYRARVETLPAPERSRHLWRMFRFLAAHDLTKSADWIIATLPSVEAEEDVFMRGIGALLALDPQRGAAVWTTALGAEPEYNRAMRYGLLLLSAVPEVDPGAFERLPAEEPVLDAMAEAGAAVCRGPGAAAALARLWDFGHRATMNWVMAAAEELDGAEAAGLYTHILDRLAAETPTGRAPPGADMAFIAAARLFRVDRDALLRRLDDAPDDGLLQRTILMGLLESSDPAAGAAARRVKRLGFSTADSIALILIAKHADSLAPEELDDLGVIVSGGGGVAAVLRTQATWLYLKHASKVEQALTAAFAGAGADEKP